MSLKSLKNQTLRNKSTINSVNLTGGASTGPAITSIIVTDSSGLFTGTKNTVLEVYQYLSKGIDAIDALGNSNYYKNVIHVHLY